MILSQVTSGSRRAFGYAASLGAVWLVAAGFRPGTTYHLAPLLLAAVVPVVATIESPGRSRSALFGLGAGGALLAMMVTGALAWLDRLRGPSLLPFGGAAAEAVVFAIAGAAAGFVVAGRLARR